MFPRNQRMGSARDITAVYRRGKKVNIDGVLVSALVSREDNSRFTVTVSKKFSGKAVARNQQKRLLLAAAKDLAEKIEGPHDITISYNNGDKMLSYDESLEILEKAFIKLTLI